MAAMNVQSGDDGAAAVNSSPRAKNRSRGVSSPWTQIVRGGSGESSEVVAPVTTTPVSPSWLSAQEQIMGSPDWSSPPKLSEVATASSPEDSGTEGQGEGSDGSNNLSKKPVWNKPSNGAVEVVSPVMGAVSWPALGESTRASPKSTSSESLKALSDASLPALQVTGNLSPSSHKQASANSANPISTPNHAAPARQRSMKRGGGSSSGNASANGGVSQPPPASQESVPGSPHNSSGKPASAAAESSPRDHTHKESQKGGSGTHSHSGNDHHHQRNSFRRGNGGNHPRGDGSYHHSYGGKRDQDRGNQEWNQHNRSFNNRDMHLQPQRGFPRGYIRPTVHSSAPFIPPPMPVVRPFGNNMMYPDVASPVIYVQGPSPSDSLRAMSLVAPIQPAMFFPVPDPQLHAKIVSQIEYYFSNENLVKDTYLRDMMDEQGWVSVHLIAGFKKVSSLTDNVQLILDLMRTSTLVEVQSDKLRRRNDWMRWIMPPRIQHSNLSSPQAAGRSSNHDDSVNLSSPHAVGGSSNRAGLVLQLQDVKLDETASNSRVPVDAFFGRSSSGEFNSPMLGGEGAVQASSQQGGFERATVA